MTNQAFLWVEKYRPKKITDCILPDSIKNTFIEFVGQKEIPNLLLSGGSGVAKLQLPVPCVKNLKLIILLSMVVKNLAFMY